MIFVLYKVSSVTVMFRKVYWFNNQKYTSKFSNIGMWSTLAIYNDIKGDKYSYYGTDIHLSILMS